MNRTQVSRCIALALAAISFGSATAASAKELLVSTGDAQKGSTYSIMFGELRAQCSGAAGIDLQESPSTGSVDNVNALVANKVDAAIVQSDLLWFRSRTDDMLKSVRTVVALHPEEVHFVARGDVRKEGGFMGLGGREVRYNTVEDLRDRPVGAVGGSVLTARVIAAQSGLNFQVVDYPNNDALKAALLDGKVDAIVAVGGAPLPVLAGLDTRFKLLPVTDALYANKSLIQNYRPAKVSYANLNATGVPTLATDAVLVSRQYRDPEMLAALGRLRQCFYDKLPVIQDKRGTHPKWQQVDPNNKGRWEHWYDLPAASGAQPAASAQPRAIDAAQILGAPSKPAARQAVTGKP